MKEEAGISAKQYQGPMTDSACCRQSARGVLQDSLRRQEKKTEALAILLKAVPWELLSSRDEEVLWGYFCENR